MPVPQPEEVMELAEELKAARSRVAELESRWEAFFQQTSSVAPARNAASPVQFLKPRIIELLESRPDMAFTMTAVANELNAKENSVGPYLSELAKERKIERRGRGFYGALTPSLEDAMRSHE